MDTGCYKVVQGSCTPYTPSTPPLSPVAALNTAGIRPPLLVPPPVTLLRQSVIGTPAGGKHKRAYARRRRRHLAKPPQMLKHGSVASVTGAQSSKLGARNPCPIFPPKPTPTHTPALGGIAVVVSPPSATVGGVFRLHSPAVGGAGRCGCGVVQGLCPCGMWLCSAPIPPPYTVV